MKKFKFLAMAIIAFAAFSCSSDSDSGPEPTIVGKWNQTKTVSTIAGNSTTQNYTDNQAGCDKDYVEFVSGGNFRNIVFNTDPQNNCIEVGDETASWTQVSTALNITGGEFSDTYEITKLSNSELRIKATSEVGGNEATVTYYFKKAS
jgi:lipocalin-like protein